MTTITIPATKCHRGVKTLMKSGGCEGCPDWDECPIPTVDEFFGREK